MTDGLVRTSRLEDVRLRARRAGHFARAVKRFDLVSFRDIADWLAREPGRLDRNEANRTAALADLRQAVLRGEFGPPEKPNVLFLPHHVPVDRIGRFPLRPTGGQIAVMQAWGVDMTDDLWAPRALIARWLAARKLDPPPWLAHVDPSPGGGKNRGGRPAVVKRDVTAWWEGLPDKDRRLNNHKLAESYQVEHPGSKVDTVRKIIGKLKEGLGRNLDGSDPVAKTG